MAWDSLLKILAISGLVVNAAYFACVLACVILHYDAVFTVDVIMTLIMEVGLVLALLGAFGPFGRKTLLILASIFLALWLPVYGTIVSFFVYPEIAIDPRSPQKYDSRMVRALGLIYRNRALSVCKSLLAGLRLILCIVVGILAACAGWAGCPIRKELDADRGIVRRRRQVHVDPCY